MGIRIGDLREPKNPPNPRRVKPTQYGPKSVHNRRRKKPRKDEEFTAGLHELAGRPKPISD